MAEAPHYRDSGAIVLIRGHGTALEVYWVRRADHVSFMPGFYAFPGGIVGPGDVALPIDGAADDRGRALRACAIRETFEEIGVLVARGGRRDAAGLEEARERLFSGQSDFGALARELGWRFHADDLQAAGRWRTPPFASARFDATYFLAQMPDGPEPVVAVAELSEGEWIAPARALERWRAGEAVFAAPILYTLRELAAGEDGLAARLDAASRRLEQPQRIELEWGIVLHPMPTGALPPATHTNAYLIGDGEMALVDPGSGDPRELEALAALIASLQADGRTLTRILLTHAHADHVGGVETLRRRYRVPVLGHHAIAEQVPLDAELADGDTLTLASPTADWALRVIHTPGHARGHLCYLHERTGALLTGDHVVGSGTVIIDPPEGDMADYMASLERLAALPVRTLFPAHGSPSGAAVGRIRALLAHRREREQRVFEVLSGVPRAPAELLGLAYADTPQTLWPYAERSLLAHLLKLEREGRASREGRGWRRGGPLSSPGVEHAGPVPGPGRQRGGE